MNEPLTCPNCKVIILDRNSKYCDMCGTALPVSRPPANIQILPAPSVVSGWTPLNIAYQTVDQPAEAQLKTADNSSLLECPKCQQKNSSRNLFCTHCGSKLNLT